MYKYFLIIVAAFVFADCAVVVHPAAHVPTPTPTTDKGVAILSQESNANVNGSYNYSFESADGTKVDQTGELKNLSPEVAVEDVHGSFSFVDPEGKTHSQQYTANEYGYFPKGDDISPEIASHLSYLESHPEPINLEVKH